MRCSSKGCPNVALYVRKIIVIGCTSREISQETR
eukprot:UN22248